MIRGVRAGSNGTIGTWLYRFNMTVDSLEFKLLGDYHGIELPYVWDIPSSTWAAKDALLSKQARHAHPSIDRSHAQIGCYWSAVAASGDPNQSPCSEVVYWPPNTGADGDFNLFLGSCCTGRGLPDARRIAARDQRRPQLQPGARSCMPHDE